MAQPVLPVELPLLEGISVGGARRTAVSIEVTTNTMNVAPAKRVVRQNFFKDRDDLAQRPLAAGCGDALIGA